MQNTSDRSILITGCSSGIGYSVAHGLRDLGYRVYPTARKAEDIDKLCDEGFDAIKLDLSDKFSVDNAFKLLMHKTHNQLYAVFHNGAYGQPGAVEDLSREVLENQFASNFFGWHQLNRLIIPIMRQQGYGRILVNSSILGFITLPMRGAYNASKFALEGLFDTLRQELSTTDHIHVSLIEPGPITSQFRQNALSAFEQNIDHENSHFKEVYVNVLRRMNDKTDNSIFTLGPEAVLKKVVHALESRKPKIRYYVTFPTYLLAWLKRLLPYRWLDKILISIAKAENK